MSENIFDKGALLKLESHIPGHTRGLKKHEKDLIKTDDSVSAAWVKTGKILFDDTELKEVVAIKNELNSMLDAMSLIFPLAGVKFIPFKNLQMAAELCDTKIIEFWDKIDYTFMPAWPGRYHQAQESLGNLFNPLDYPGDIRSKFGLSYQFLNLAAPNGAVRVVDSELYERETEKFKQTMAEAQELAVMALRSEFADIVGSLVERLTPTEDGKSKVFRDSLVGNFKDFFDGFLNRNVFEDSELSELVNRAKDIIGGADAETLRKSPLFAQGIKDQMSSIHAAIQAAIVDRPGRKISI